MEQMKDQNTYIVKLILTSNDIILKLINSSYSKQALLSDTFYTSLYLPNISHQVTKSKLY